MNEIELQKKARSIWRILKKKHPGPKVALVYSNPFELLVSTILSAQCTDERVDKVTKVLFSKYKKPGDFADAPLSDLEKIISSVGLFRTKSKNIKLMAQTVITNHKGKLPGTMEELVKLPGVGRKTANVLLGAYFGVPSIVVDTHVKRVSNRLELSSQSNPEKIEMDLQKLILKKDWSDFAMAILLHGRYVCVARSPKCDGCPLAKLCNFTKD